MQEQDRPRAELGRGWAFPLRLDRRGKFRMTDGQAKVAESIRLILGTALGERVMRSDFGSEVPGLLLEPLTPGTVSRLREAIEVALARWEPRIDLLEVNVARDPAVSTQLVASLRYRLRENNSLFNQVFPFYINEGTEDF